MSTQKESVCEENTFKMIFDNHSEVIRNFIYYKCGDMAQAEDITQDAFIKLWKNCKKVLIHKAKSFGFDLNGAVMASDAFFPFPDCVEIAGKEGVKAVVQPGGSIKDELSIDYCNKNNISMVFTGTRHFKH